MWYPRRRGKRETQPTPGNLGVWPSISVSTLSLSSGARARVKAAIGWPNSVRKKMEIAVWGCIISNILNGVANWMIRRYLRSFVMAGGLISYGAPFRAWYRGAWGLCRPYSQRRQTAYRRTEPIPTGIANGRYRGMRTRSAAKAERPLSVQSTHVRGDAGQRVRRAVNALFLGVHRTGQADRMRTFGDTAPRGVRMASSFSVPSAIVYGVRCAANETHG